MMTRILLFGWLILSSTWLQAALEASVDRSRLVAGETLELTLEMPAAGRLSELDLSPLEENFEIQNRRQLSLVSQIDGVTAPVTRWVITLNPVRTGFVVIPPIALKDGSASQPISLHVLSAAQAATDKAARLAPVFIDSQVDVLTPYVQAQVILTLHIFHSVSLFDDSSLSGLDISNARVESLGPPRHFERLIDGVRHGVIEARYAIFPQQSGDLDIPSQLFSATVLQPRSDGSRALSSTGKLIQVRSPSMTLAVRPIPDSYPESAPWIPASGFKLSQTWQPDPGTDLLSGEPLTRTLIMEAQGLSASQLPVLQSLSEDTDSELRQYADQPQLESRLTEEGIHGIRLDSAALVALQEGTYSLPAIQVNWWNTQTDQLETAQLDAVTLNVNRSNEFPTAITPVNQPPQQPILLWPWQLATLLLSLALGSTLYLLWRLRNTVLAYRSPETEEHLDDVIDGNPLADLQTACRANQPAEARKALELWARQQESDGLITLSQNYVELEEALEDLNACLFGQTHHNWRGKPLWRAVRMVIQSQRREASEEPSDKPASLYPDV